MVTKSNKKGSTKGNTKSYTKKQPGDKSVAKIIVDRLIDKIEEAADNRMPWQKPFNVDCMNWYSGHKYKGINLFLLYGGSGEYITFKQLMEYNEKNKTDFRVKKGSDEIVLFSNSTRNNISEAKAKELINKGYGRYVIKDNDGNYFHVRFNYLYHRVYDIAKIFDSKGNKLPSKLAENKDATEYPTIEEALKTYMDRSEVGLKFNNQKGAFYVPTSDYVSTPEKDRYKSNERYFSTLCHEFIHSTGHKKRLNRRSLYEYREEDGTRSREEFIAEVGANILMSKCGIDLDSFNFENSLNYVAGWCSWMSDNPEEVLRGMTDVEKAVEYFLVGEVEKKENKESKDKETVIKEVEKLSLENQLKLLYKQSKDDGDRGKKVWNRLCNSPYLGKLVNQKDEKLKSKFNVVKMVNGEPLLELIINDNTKLICGMTFAIIELIDKKEYKVLYSRSRGDSFIEGYAIAKRLKLWQLDDLIYCMNLKSSIKSLRDGKKLGLWRGGELED